MGTYTKEKAISIVVTCAETYKRELVNRTLLFVCQDKHKKISCIEFTFDISNFMHLTGLKCKNGSATEFFDKCIEHRLSKNDFDFSKDGTSHLKLSVLPGVINKSLSATMVGDYNSYNPKLFTDKLVGGVKACVGFVATGNRKRYVPNTLLRADIRDYTVGTARVLAVFRKYKDDEKYTEMTYKVSTINLNEITFPPEYEYLKTIAE